MLKPPLTRLVPRLLRVSAEVLNLCRFRSSSILEFTPSFAAVSFPLRGEGRHSMCARVRVARTIAKFTDRLRAEDLLSVAGLSSLVVRVSHLVRALAACVR